MPYADRATMKRDHDLPASARASLPAFALIVGLFFLWGVANNLNDILIKQFKNAFALTDFQAGLVQSAFYLGYFLLAIPAGVCMRRFGFKSAILVGLALYAVGALLFYPAAATQTYAVFLAGLFVIASGLSFLETSANPLVTVLGSPEGGARRLNFAQSFNPLGSIAGVLIGREFIFNGVEHTPRELATMTPEVRHAYFTSQVLTVQTPYLVIAGVVIVFALLIALVRFPAHGEHSAHGTSGGRHIGRLLRDRHFLSAVAAQFFYVGAQVGVWSYLIRYCQGTLPGTPEKRAADYLTASLVLFTLGRFAGTALMKFIAPRRLLAAFAVVNVALCALAVAWPGMPGLVALVIVSFFMSVMYPTIFALGVDGFSDSDRKLGASFLVMAIVGGAVLTALTGAVSDAVGIARAMLVPLGCFVAVFLFALQRGRDPQE
ncbi:MAG: L-fucose:H+ symporter permease [Rhodanobacteraceae bacterium]|nr:MAG: L-fucose:H+ symporter permease [Rhodanobacteraceae bacterium]